MRGLPFFGQFIQANMQNLCLIDQQFDANKEFEKGQTLKSFDLSPAGNCEVFVNKFPDFDLKTKK
jgi:hypothetical protein